MAIQTIHPRPPYPLHESIKDLLDPDYVKFYNKYLLEAPQVHYQPVAASRVGGRLIPVSFPHLPSPELPANHPRAAPIPSPSAA